MRILFITDNFPPETNAPATRTFEHCKEWVKQGTKITVVTGAPNFPNGKVFKGYKNYLRKVDIIEGIKVIRVWSYITRNKGFSRRILDYISFSLSAFFWSLFLSFDVIIATSPQFFTTWSAFALSKIKRRPWIFELRDIWPESIKSVGMISNKKAYDILERIELFLYKDCNKVIPVTEAFKTNLIRRGVCGDKISVVTNGSNLDLFSEKERDKNIEIELGLKGKTVIGYIGTHGLAQGLDFIITAIAEIPSKEVHFLFIGDGSEKERVKKLARQWKLQNITFLDSVPKQEIAKYLSVCDICLVPLKRSDTFKTVIPSKIFEAAAMKKPVLLGVSGQAKEIIEKYGAGICYEPENKADFIEKLLLVTQNKVLYEQLQDGCEQLAKDFNRKNLANIMLRELETVYE